MINENSKIEIPACMQKGLHFLLPSTRCPFQAFSAGQEQWMPINYF